MGWWSTDIMGGDSPLDWEDSFYSICKVKKWPDDSSEMAQIPKEALQAHVEKIVEEIEEVRETWDKQVAYQALAVVMMRSGCEIEENLKANMICAAHLDEWAEEDEDRRKACNDLIQKLKDYQGTPTEVRSKGLFEVLGEAIKDGQKLINKTPPTHE